MIPEPPGAAGPIKLGMLAWNQYTTWPAMREAAVAADRLGYDDIWTWDQWLTVGPLGACCDE